MNFNFKEIVSATMILFAVIDIIGTLPIVIDLRAKVGHIKSEKTSLAAAFIMLSFLFLGESILKLIGIDIGSFAVAGSIVIFFVSMEFILGIRLYRDTTPQAASIVPLAFPILAGAGTMTTLLSLRAEYAVENIVVAVLINILLIYVVLKSATRVEKFLGPTGIAITRKIFGIILLSLAIKLFRTNFIFSIVN